MSDKLIESGTVTFASRVRPALLPGEYKLEIKSKLSVDGKAPPARSAKLSLMVDCEHTVLPPDQMYSTYPPRRFSGNYGKCLPHIILQRCTFPWELKVCKTSPDALPWVALLVFPDSEGARLSTLELKSNGSGALAAPAKTFVPAIYKKINVELEPEGEHANVVDIPAGLFSRVLPLDTELPLLTHVRNVSLDDKVTDSSVTDGWFSCVVANRLPLAPESAGDMPVPHRAHLVSLEGFESFLPLSPTDREALLRKGGCEWVRMFSLYSWDFCCSRAEMDFDVCAGSLQASVIRGDTQDLKDPELTRAVKLGYCPVNHVMREGSAAVSWYRPPLLPQKPGRDYIPFGSFADALLRYDKELDMLDVTYSAAWQLGRLLALQNQSFASELVRWRMENKSRTAAEHNRHYLKRMCLEALPENAPQNDMKVQAVAGSGSEPESVVWKDYLHGMEDACGMSDPLDIIGTELEELVELIDFTGISNKMDAIYRRKPETSAKKRMKEDGKPEDLIPLLRSLRKKRR